ncbi:MAG: transcriptional regulator [Phyllobacteriaceae bacterium]|nr:transcriptional regulator [Phyllobacteriaceae bacterium]MBA90278.1 transcriptional regulator [Phyllobacteriaceae bacterium]
MTLTVRHVCDTPDMLGESPVWDHRHGRLYWVDGVSRRIRCLDPSTGETRHWETPSMVGSVALAEGSRLICGLVDGIWLMDTGTGTFEALFRPEPADPAVRFNDGKTDRQGRFLCGSMGIHADPLGKLWRVDGEGRTRVFATGIRIANALCFSPDGRTMYFADSLERIIRAFPYGPSDDDLGEPRVFVDTGPWDSGPDGATVDSEGYLWVCLIQVGKIARFSPDGQLDRLIDAPTDLPSSLAFGGPDLDTLYVTSIRDSGSGRAISRHPDGGRLHAIEGLGVRGLPETPFRAAARKDAA